jgi:chromosome partitioning protein
MFIAVVNQKGGVGKTTLAVHLALWAQESGLRTALIDADGQSTSSAWIRGTGAAVDVSPATDADGIIETANMLAANHDVIIADGPANLADSTRALLLVADLAVLPCGGTLPELESTLQTVRILRNAQRVRAGGVPAALLVLTRLRCRHYQLSKEAPLAAARLGVPVCGNWLHLREATADAPGQRTTVWRLGRRGEHAAREMKNVLEEIWSHARHTQVSSRNPLG